MRGRVAGTSYLWQNRMQFVLTLEHSPIDSESASQTSQPPAFVNADPQLTRFEGVNERNIRENRAPGTIRQPFKQKASFFLLVGFIHRSWMRGYPEHVFDGRPVIGICNTWSELTPCNAHLRDIAERVKNGVWEAGAFPLEFPVTSLSETNMRPTSMLFRNLVSMDVEESIRANPLDGVVLLCGCDKTVPALIMGAASCDLPTIVLSGGPMLNGKFHGQDIGSGTDLWRFSEEVKAGRMSLPMFREAEVCMSRSAGHCMTMGTASSMACMVEALGLGLPQKTCACRRFSAERPSRMRFA
jgi:dihydroxyacid dehydratase/phosphogluconate dehydratase